jgi:hypothetical protein
MERGHLGDDDDDDDDDDDELVDLIKVDSHTVNMNFSFTVPYRMDGMKSF